MRILILLILGIYFSTLNAQNQELTAGFLPELGMNFKLSKKFRMIFKAEAMNGIYDYAPSEGADTRFDFRRTDLQGFIDYRINPLMKIAAGYQHRFQDEGDNSNRLIQQLSMLQRFIALRISHRIRTDQTFFKSEETEFRFRYRLLAEFPLQGRSIDPGEFYLIVSEEPIYSIQDTESDIENRLTGSVGFLFNNNNKLQAGLDYRVDKLLLDGLRQQFWMKIGWYLSF